MIGRDLRGRPWFQRPHIPGVAGPANVGVAGGIVGFVEQRHPGEGPVRPIHQEKGNIPDFLNIHGVFRQQVAFLRLCLDPLKAPGPMLSVFRHDHGHLSRRQGFKGEGQLLLPALDRHGAVQRALREILYPQRRHLHLHVRLPGLDAGAVVGPLGFHPDGLRGPGQAHLPAASGVDAQGKARRHAEGDHRQSVHAIAPSVPPIIRPGFGRNGRKPSPERKNLPAKSRENRKIHSKICSIPICRMV